MATTNTTLSAAWKRIPLAVGEYRLQTRGLRLRALVELAETDAANNAPAASIKGWLLPEGGERYPASAARFLWARVIRAPAGSAVLVITPAS